MQYKIIVNDSDTAIPIGDQPERLINNLPCERLTGALQRIFGREYLASTFCRDIFAIVRRLPGGMRESVRGASWTEVLRKAKAKWSWAIPCSRGGSHG